MNEYLELALKFQNKHSKNLKNDVSIASTLCELGWCVLETDPKKAQKVFSKALRIMEEATLDSDSDRKFAMILQGIGKSCLVLKKLKEAMFYSEKALQINKKHLCNDDDTDIFYLSSQYTIGECYAIMDNSAEAVDYFKNVLQVQESLAQHKNGSKAVIHNTKNVGCCLLWSEQPND